MFNWLWAKKPSHSYERMGSFKTGLYIVDYVWWRINKTRNQGCSLASLIKDAKNTSDAHNILFALKEFCKRKAVIQKSNGRYYLLRQI